MPQIARALREAADPRESSQVAQLLDDAERRMELHGDRDWRVNARLAGALVSWHEWSRARGGSPPLDRSD